MRFLLSLFPVSRREANKAADVLNTMSVAEIMNAMLITAMGFISIPVILLLLQTPGAWA